MRVLIALLLLSGIAYAGQTAIRDATVTAIPANYADAGSELMSGVRANSICCENRTGADIYICLRANGAAACGDDWRYANGTGTCLDMHALANKVFMRGVSGVVNTGYFQCRVW